MNEILNNDGGFIEAYWDGTKESELKIKDLTKATIRCLPLDPEATGNCILTGKKDSQKQFLLELIKFKK